MSIENFAWGVEEINEKYMVLEFGKIPRVHVIIIGSNFCHTSESCKFSKS
jgi:hypothetical protein